MKPPIDQETMSEWLRRRLAELAPDLSKLKEEYVRLWEFDPSDLGCQLAELEREICRQEQACRVQIGAEWDEQLKRRRRRSA